MSARFGVSGSGNVGSAARTLRRREGLPWMNVRQTEAYLIARDALRRIQRISPLVAPTLEARAKSVGRLEAPRPRPQPRDRHVFGGLRHE